MAPGCIRGGVRLLAILLCALPAMGQIADGDGSIAGRVANSITGAGVEKARVTLVLEMQRTGLGHGAKRDTVTDAQGRFAFPRLEPGIYSVGAEEDGFLRPGYRSSGSYSLVLGEHQELDSALLRLVPVGAMVVKVLHSDGRPANLVTVRTSAGGASPLGRACTTGAEGSCRMANLAPGDYSLEASPNELHPVSAGQQMAEVATFFPGGARLGAGEVRTVEIKLAESPTVEIRGKVGDPRLNGATTFVNLVARNGSAARRSVTPEADGSFLLTGVPAGSYDLTAERVSGFPAEKATTMAVGALHTDAVVARPIDVSDRNLEGIELAMAPLREIHGTVRTEDGAVCPLSSAIDTVTRLSLRPEIPVLSSMREAQIDVDFTLSGVAPVRHQVQVWYLGACYLKSISYGGKEADGSIVDMASQSSLDITFAMGGRVSGVVVDAAGKLMARATVTLSAKSGETPQLPIILTDARGSFHIRGIRPGSYDVFAWEGAMDMTGPAPELLKAFAVRGAPVTVSKGGVETVRLTAIPAAEIGKVAGTYSSPPPPAKANGSMAGQVVDGTGIPLKNATLKLKGWGDATPEATVETDAQGRFEFRNLAPGLYHVTEHRDMPWGDLIVGEGQRVMGIRLQMEGQ
jgi:hypothetical protein